MNRYQCHFVYVQEIPVAKLMAMASVTIDIVSSQDRMCVHCVTNGLLQKHT